MLDDESPTSANLGNGPGFISEVFWGSSKQSHESLCSKWTISFYCGESCSSNRGQYLLAVGLDCYKWYQSQTQGGVRTRKLGPEGGWIVRSHIGWRVERNILYKGVKTSP